MEGLDAASELHRFRRRHAAVDFDAQVHLVADELAVLPHGVDGGADLARVGFEIWPLVRLVEEGREVPHGGESRVAGLRDAAQQLFTGVAEDVRIDARAVAHLSAEQLVDRRLEMLAGDVPQGDVDGADGCHDRRAAEGAPAVEILPVMLDPQRVLAHQVAGELLDGGLRGFQKAPGAGLAQAREPGVRLDLDQQVLVEPDGLDAADAHRRHRGRAAYCPPVRGLGR